MRCPCEAAVVYGPGSPSLHFPDPSPGEGELLISVCAAALSPLTKGRASGAHYSADGVYPAVPGVDGVGATSDGRRVYFVMPAAPNGAMAQKTVVSPRQCIELPAEIDDITAAAIANPGMSAMAALVERAHLVPGKWFSSTVPQVPRARWQCRLQSTSALPKSLPRAATRRRLKNYVGWAPTCLFLST